MTGSPSSVSPLPVVRLKPKADVLRIRRGAPWVYADDIVTDRRTKNINPGAVAILHDPERQELGLVAFNGKSKIMVRMLDSDVDAVLDQAWFEAKFARALEMRQRLYDAPYYRLIHAEGDGLPGVVVDRFGDTCVVQANAAWADIRFEMLVDALVAVTGVVNVYKNASGRTRELEGLDAESGVARGTLDGSLPVVMNGATYIADIAGGRKPDCSMTNGLTTPSRPRWLKAHGCWTCFRMSVALGWRHWQVARPRRWPLTDRSLRWIWH